jgi:hypothetical protein
VSIQYIATALDRVPGLTSSEAFVLVVLCNSASDDTLECWPSIKTIARRTRLDERTVRRCLRRLEELELVETAHGGHQYGRNTSSRYRMRFDAVTGAKLDRPRVSELSPRGALRQGGGGMVSDKGGMVPGQGGRNAPPSVIETSLNQRGAKSAAIQESRARKARQLTDEELEERAQSGKLTAAEENERELRRRSRPRSSAA